MSKLQRVGIAPDGDGGRDDRGRFGKGNKLSRGNPHARQVALIRAALMRAVKPEDIEQAARKLVQQAKAGCRFSFAELMDRTIGRVPQMEIILRLEAIEQSLQMKFSTDGEET
jgi:hypothetical protein